MALKHTTLADYITRKRWTHAQAADAFGLDVSQISRLLAGKRGPSLATAYKIETATGGRVKMESFLPPEMA